MQWSLLYSARVVVFTLNELDSGEKSAGLNLIEFLRDDENMPDDVALIDAGEEVRLMLEELRNAMSLPKRIVFVADVSHSEHQAGEFFEISLEGEDPKKLNDDSMQLFPTLHLLAEFASQTGVDVKVLAVQMDVSQDESAQDLSLRVREALPRMAAKVKQWCAL